MKDDLGPRGQTIWDSYQADRLNPAIRALVAEYARQADNLDRMDALVRGKQESWAILVFDDMGELHLEISKLLDEQRKAMVVFKQLHAELRAAGVKATEQASGGAVAAGPAETPLERRRREKAERERRIG